MPWYGRQTWWYWWNKHSPYWYCHCGINSNVFTNINTAKRHCLLNRLNRTKGYAKDGTNLWSGFYHLRLYPTLFRPPGSPARCSSPVPRTAGAAPAEDPDAAAACPGDSDRPAERAECSVDPVGWKAVRLAAPGEMRVGWEAVRLAVPGEMRWSVRSSSGAPF